MSVDGSVSIIVTPEAASDPVLPYVSVYVTKFPGATFERFVDFRMLRAGARIEFVTELLRTLLGSSFALNNAVLVTAPAPLYGELTETFIATDPVCPVANESIGQLTILDIGLNEPPPFADTKFNPAASVSVMETPVSGLFPLFV